MEIKTKPTVFTHHAKSAKKLIESFRDAYLSHKKTVVEEVPQYGE